MTDKELLELAAKAAKIEHKIKMVTPCYRGDPNFESLRRVRHANRRNDWVEWNPLEDDSDALRLAIKLGISILSGTYKVVCEIIPQEDSGDIAVHEQYGSDEYAATRRAIVRAAAEIGMDTK